MKFFKQLFCKHIWIYIKQYYIENYNTDTGYQLCKEYECSKCYKIGYNVR